MNRLEILDGESWESLVSSDLAVLMLGKSDCEACGRWTEELETFLATDEEMSDVRFGKLLLDKPGLGSFKRAHGEWVAGLENLPYTVIWVRGERRKEFAGTGIDRLLNRLRGVREQS